MCGGSHTSAVLRSVTVSRSSRVFSDFELGNADENPSVTWDSWPKSTDCVLLLWVTDAALKAKCDVMK